MALLVGAADAALPVAARQDLVVPVGRVRVRVRVSRLAKPL